MKDEVLMMLGGTFIKAKNALGLNIKNMQIYMSQLIERS